MSNYGGDDCLKEDMMLKRSIMKKSLFAQENYRMRLFQLTRRALRYCEGTQATGPTKEKGMIMLNQVKAVENVEEDGLGKPYTFQVLYYDEVQNQNFTLYIVANNDNQRSDWVKALREACENCGAFLTEMYHPGVWQKRKAQYTCCGLRMRQSPGCKPTYNERQETDTPPPNVQQHIARNTLNNNVRRPAVAVPPVPPERPPMIIKEVVAIYSYEAIDDTDMTLMKGERYEVLEDTHPHWWKARNKAGQEGYIPANYVKDINQNMLELYAWYFKGITRLQSEAKLRDEKREGCFLVRDSSQSDAYTLSVYCKDGNLELVRHYHIKINDVGYYYFSDRHAFPTIHELIQYHKFNAGGLVTRLRCSPSENAVVPGTVGLSHDKWEIDPSEIKPYIDREIGKGEFGSVYLARWKGKMMVAVKMMNKNAMSEDSFIEEAHTMTQLSHPNLVRLYGVCTKERPIYIVTEFMKNGALLTYLTRNRCSMLGQPDRLIDMCLHVCRGMSFLEEKGFLHRDLAARNCLVGEENIVKVADFGLARFVLDNEYTSSNGAKFPIRWAAPEVLKYFRFSSFSDVWAFGVLMWEVFSGGETPYTKKYSNAEVVTMVVEHHYRLVKPEKCPPRVYEVMLKCWEEEARDRYTFRDLENILSELSETTSMK